MKKFLNVVLCTLIVSLMLPIFVSAEVKEFDFTKTKRETLEEAIAEEEITNTFTHKDNEKQVTIYLFRGHGCGYCHKFLEYVSSDLMKEYGSKFKFVSYEVWNNSGNAELFQEIAKFLGTEANGVPFYVIGDKYFSGYSETMNDSIIEAIETEYASSEKYDVIKKYKDSIETAKRKEWDEKYGAIYKNGLITLVIVAIGVGVNIWFTNKKFEELQSKNLKARRTEEKVTEVIDLEKKEPVKKSTKKTTKKSKK